VSLITSITVTAADQTDGWRGDGGHAPLPAPLKSAIMNTSVFKYRLLSVSPFNPIHTCSQCCIRICNMLLLLVLS